MENSRNFAGKPHTCGRVGPTLRSRLGFPEQEVCLTFRARPGPPLERTFTQRRGQRTSEAQNLGDDVVLIEDSMKPRCLVLGSIESEAGLGFG